MQKQVLKTGEVNRPSSSWCLNQRLSLLIHTQSGEWRTQCRSALPHAMARIACSRM